MVNVYRLHHRSQEWATPVQSSPHSVPQANEKWSNERYSVGGGWVWRPLIVSVRLEFSCETTENGSSGQGMSLGLANFSQWFRSEWTAFINKHSIGRDGAKAICVCMQDEGIWTLSRIQNFSLAKQRTILRAISSGHESLSIQCALVGIPAEIRSHEL